MKLQIKLFIATIVLATSSNSFASANTDSLLDAIEKQDVSLVGSLLRYGVNPNHSTSMYNTTPLMYAVDVGADKVVESLLNNGSQVDVADHFGNTPLINAINTNKVNIASLLINKSRNVNIRDEKGISALHYAAKHGNEPLFRKLLQKGGDLNAIDKSGNNALFFAIAGRNKEIVNRLLNMNYFNLSHTNGLGESAFHIAQRYGMHDIAQRVNKGRNI